MFLMRFKPHALVKTRYRQLVEKKTAVKVCVGGPSKKIAIKNKNLKGHYTRRLLCKYL